ncbi:aminoglycoside phosphotransferase family protein [Actinomadura sp. 9N215]|uniref:aminoglycoside phosphotransferase family protein n=1 Tax=Actinomadura sp. 9N215 TaxID=3375150 RepID=UPI00378CB987
MPGKSGLEGAGAVSAPFPVLNEMLIAHDFPPAIRREPIHVWAMSSVERVHLEDEQTVILKSAASPFAREASTLRHVADHVPVPRVHASRILSDGRLAMLLQDLGEHPEDDPSLTRGARAAVRIHECMPPRNLPRLSRPRLASLPVDALASWAALQRAGRWTDTEDIRQALFTLGDIGHYRSRGATTPPFGLCHSEFHPTSLHDGPAGLYVLDWARAFVGPGLLDLASWEDTPKPLNTNAIADMIVRYVEEGGHPEAMAKRDGLPPQIWAGGWHRVWISEWYMQQCLFWIPDPANDATVQKAVRRHLGEALECLG